MAKSNFVFIQEKMGKDGIERFCRAEVEELKRHNASLSLNFLKLIRAISPHRAFNLTADEFTCAMQW